MQLSRGVDRIREYWHWIIGLVALLWVLLRSGANPGRLAYPCQQVARPLALQWLLAVSAYVAGSLLLRRLGRYALVGLVSVGVAWFVLAVPEFSRSDSVSPGSLPVWEVTDPVSTVYVMDSLPPTTGSLADGLASVPDAYLADPAIDTLLAMLAADDILLHKTAAQPAGLIGADHVVIIKGNFQWTSRNTTSTDRIKGLIWQILQHPEGFSGEILVCDNTQDVGTGVGHNDNNSEDPAQSILDVVSTFAGKGYPVYCHDWSYMWSLVAQEYDQGDYADGYIYEQDTRISYPKFQTPSGAHHVSLKNGVWDSLSTSYDSTRLCIIDFPVPKSHVMAGATLAVKNWIGVLTTAYANQRYGSWDGMHYTYFWGPYALVARLMAVTFPRLTIVDGTWTSGYNPNVLEDTVNTNVLVASTDPVAASWYAAKFVLTPVARYPSWTDPDLPGGRYRNTLSTWTAFLHDSVGLACTMDSTEISVYDRNFTRRRIDLVGDAFLDTTGGDGDGIPEAGETVSLVASFAHTFDTTVTDVTLRLSVDDASLNVLQGTSYLGNIHAGDTVDNGSDPFTLEIPVGYIPRLATLVLDVTWNGGTRQRRLVLDRGIGGALVLLVDDDASDTLETYYRECLSNLRIPSDTFTSSPGSYPDSALLDGYDVVIWFTGDYRTDPLAPAELSALRGYLDGGGKLFLSGQGIAAQLAVDDSLFLHDYLQSDYVSSALIAVLCATPGGAVFSAADSIMIQGGGGAGNQLYPDQITPRGGAAAEMHYISSPNSGAVSYSGSYGLVFCAFGFEAIVDGDSRWTERTTILSEILEFLDYAAPACPLTVAVEGEPNHVTDHTPTLLWSYCSGESATQQQYQIQVGSDNDWTVAEMWDYGPVVSTDTGVTYAGSELLDGTSYHLRVRVSDGSTWSQWYYSEFSMNSLPSAPADLQPTGGATVADGTPALVTANATDAEGDPLSYEYEVYADSLLTTLVTQATGEPEGYGDTSLWIVSPALPDNASYYWRVRAHDGYEDGPWSDQASFFVTALYTLGDTNDDGTIAAADIIWLVNYVFKAGPPPLPVEESGDVNCDLIVTAADVVFMVNFVFKSGPAPYCP